ALGSGEVDLGRPRLLEVTVWEGPARRRSLAHKRFFRFHHVDKDAYASMMDVSYDPVDEMAKIVVRHLRSDPGKGYITDVVARVAGADQIATISGDGNGPPCKIPGDQFYGFWFHLDPKTPMVKWSVKIGKQNRAFEGTLTVGGEPKEKDKD